MENDKKDLLEIAESNFMSTRTSTNIRKLMKLLMISIVSNLLLMGIGSFHMIITDRINNPIKKILDILT